MHPPLRRLGSLVAVALLALLAGCTKPVASLEQPQEWTRDLPAKYGTPLDTRIALGTVLVTTTVGLIGMDPKTGAEKWWRDYSKDFTDTAGNEMSRGVAMFRVTVAGDAVVVTKSEENTPGDTGRQSYEVLDLASGQTRFTALPKTDIADGWFFVHVTKTSIVTFDCLDLIECDITSLPLDGGAPLWTIKVPGGRADLPEQLSWNQERGYSADGMSPPKWVVAEEPEFALINDDKKNTTRALDLVTGRLIGEWEQADTRAWYIIVGPTVVEVGAGDVLRGLDPTTGQERWQHTLLGAGTHTPFGYHGLLMDGGLLVDESESSSGTKSYQHIDLMTGPQGQALTAPEPNALVLTGGLVVTTDMLLSQVNAVDPATGQQKWTVALDNNDGRFRLNESVLHEGTLVVGASPGFEEPGALHAIDTATGKLRTWAGEFPLGCGDGLLVSYSGTETDGFALHSHWL